MLRLKNGHQKDKAQLKLVNYRNLSLK